MAPLIQSIVESLNEAGFSLSLTPAGGLAVVPASKLTPELREVIRSGRADLIRWFTQAAEADFEPSIEPAAWRELAAAFHAHHFNCPTCQAAGRGAQYGLRCGVGAALWTTYQHTN